MSTRFNLVLWIILISLPAFVSSSGNEAEAAGSPLTGEILTLLYVSDVRESVSFYRGLGFEHDYYYDYRQDNYTRKWGQPYLPEYAEMIRGKIRVGLTTAVHSEQVYGGGVRHYFMVTDVESHYVMVKRNGITPEPDEIEERPWMNFFTVSDPDNHQIVFGEKNQAYYDQARKEIDSLQR